MIFNLSFSACFNVILALNIGQCDSILITLGTFINTALIHIDKSVSHCLLKKNGLRNVHLCFRKSVVTSLFIPVSMATVTFVRSASGFILKLTV